MEEWFEEDVQFNKIDPTKHDAVIKSKSILWDAMVSMDGEISSLKDKLESGNLDFGTKEFKLGYPERFANGEFYPIEDYWKDTINVKTGGVNICPHGTIGSSIVLDELTIHLPKPPKDKSDILFSDKSKKDQYWRRVKPPKISMENVEMWNDYILEEYRRRREGVWFMNNGKPVYLTGNHYFALSSCRMKDNGGYMDFRIAQCTYVLSC